jgi:hypothetical protein
MWRTTTLTGAPTPQSLLSVLCRVADSNIHLQLLAGCMRHMGTAYRTSISVFDIEHMIANMLTSALVTTYHNAIALSLCMIILTLMQRTEILRRRSRSGLRCTHRGTGRSIKTWSVRSRSLARRTRGGIPY